MNAGRPNDELSSLESSLRAVLTPVRPRPEFHGAVHQHVERRMLAMNERRRQALLAIRLTLVAIAGVVGGAIAVIAGARLAQAWSASRQAGRGE